MKDIAEVRTKAIVILTIFYYTERPLPSNENIFAIMDDWKKNAKKGDKEDENRFVFKLKSPMKDEDVVEDPVRVHLLYLEVLVSISPLLPLCLMRLFSREMI